jgi:hypothetical protein
VAKAHTGFRKFIRNLSAEPKIWKELKFSRPEDFAKYLREINQLALDIERLAPAECQNGPNPEYPWPPPPQAPVQSPVHYDFPLWRVLAETSRGKRFLDFLRTIIRVFPERF